MMDGGGLKLGNNKVVVFLSIEDAFLSSPAHTLFEHFDFNRVLWQVRFDKFLITNHDSRTTCTVPKQDLFLSQLVVGVNLPPRANERALFGWVKEDEVIAEGEIFTKASRIGISHKVKAHLLTENGFMVSHALLRSWDSSGSPDGARLDKHILQTEPPRPQSKPKPRPPRPPSSDQSEPAAAQGGRGREGSAEEGDSGGHKKR